MIDINKFPYPEIRPSQLDVINRINKGWDKFRYIVIEAGTGFGKSALAKTICESSTNAFILTATKQLQDQYIKDFPGEISTIKGKSNYTCDYNPKLNCDIGPCTVNKELIKDCLNKGNCYYYQARDAASRAKITVTSYSYFLRIIETPNKVWKRRSTLIIDECHLLEQQLTSWASVVIKPRELNDRYEIFSDVSFDQFVILSSPPENAGYEQNRIWLTNIWNLIKRKHILMYDELKDSMDGKGLDELTEEDMDKLSAINKSYFDLDKLYKRLQVFFETQDKSNWIIEPQDDGIIIQPVNTGVLFKKYLDSWGIDHVIFMSATILDVKGFCSELGISKDEVGIIRIDSTFSSEKSPIYFYSCGKMDYKNIDKNIPKIVEQVKEILAKHPDEKGIIHTSNYKLAKAIAENVTDPRLLIKKDKESNEKLISRHIRSKHPTVLVSPSLTTGTDLKDDLSRFQILVKLPFASLMDKRIKKKIEYNPEWYVCEMFKTMIQACGRSTRSEKDYSKTYILDSSFYYWVYKYKHWMTNQFLRRIKWKKED